MPDITKVSTPSSGAISFSDLNTALRNSSGTEISLGDADVRNLLSDLSGAIGMNSAYSKYLPYGSVVHTVTDSTNSDASTFTFTSCSFGTAASDRIILCVVTYWNQYGNLGDVGYSTETIGSATIGGVSATCAGRNNAYAWSNTNTHRQQMCVFWAQVPSGTSGSVSYTLNSAGWDNSESFRSGNGRTLTIYSFYGLNTSNPIEYSVHNQKNDNTTGTTTLGLTLYPGDSKKDKLLLLLTGRNYIDQTTTNNYFKINSSTKTPDWQYNVGDGQGAIGYLTNDVPTTSTFTADSVTGDILVNNTSDDVKFDLEATCFIGIILAKNPASAQSVSFAPSLTYTAPPPPPPPPPAEP